MYITIMGKVALTGKTIISCQRLNEANRVVPFKHH